MSDSKTELVTPQKDKNPKCCANMVTFLWIFIYGNQLAIMLINTKGLNIILHQNVTDFGCTVVSEFTLVLEILAFFVLNVVIYGNIFLTCTRHKGEYNYLKHARKSQIMYSFFIFWNIKLMILIFSIIYLDTSENTMSKTHYESQLGSVIFGIPVFVFATSILVGYLNKIYWNRNRKKYDILVNESLTFVEVSPN